MTEPLGLEPGAIRLVDYDGRWPALFAAERERILVHAGALPLTLEHVGGTSIPGMPTKPVLDIAAGRPRGAPVHDYVLALGRAGYEHRGERGVPGREFFCRGVPRAYHLHLVEDGSALWRDYLAFRDHLRRDAAAARRFAEGKRTLAARFPLGRAAYTAAKSTLVEAVLKEARPRGHP
jgi:GrpB-like predicted nucleotidyltransferase (UPF0157 family)